jgi:glycosyltransferase involved in cell wall biosynthesis
MHNNKISVCMATYNGEKYIKQQLFSIINQLPNSYDEILISDNSSSDDTILRIQEIDDNRIKIYNSNARNVIFNFENSISKATGDYIFLADQDDIWSKDKIKIILPELEENLLVFSNFILFNDDKNIDKENTLFDKGINQSGFIKNLIKNRFTGATMAFKKELLDYAMPFPKSIPMHDIWLGLLAEYYGKVKYIDIPLLYYRKHTNNLSETGLKSSKKITEKLKTRYNLIVCFSKRILQTK